MSGVQLGGRESATREAVMWEDRWAGHRIAYIGQTPDAMPPCCDLPPAVPTLLSADPDT